MNRVPTYLVLLGALLTYAIPFALSYVIGEVASNTYTWGLKISPTSLWMMAGPGIPTTLIALYQLVRGVDRVTAALAFVGGFAILSISLWGPAVGLTMPFGPKMYAYHWAAGAIAMIGAALQLRQLGVFGASPAHQPV